MSAKRNAIKLGVREYAPCSYAPIHSNDYTILVRLDPSWWGGGTDILENGTGVFLSGRLRLL